MSKICSQLFYFVFILFICLNCQANNLEKLQLINLQVISQDKRVVNNFKVYVASDIVTRQNGLMNIKNLPQDHGMLFIFKKSQLVNMWMKDTLIPLDMIFIDKNNLIVNIAENAKPNSLEIISSIYKVDKILELNAGIIDKFNIKINDYVKYN